MEKRFKFTDAEGQLVICKLEVENVYDERRDWETLEPIVQTKKVCLDFNLPISEIVPDTDLQEELVEFARSGKFDDIKAGTKSQMEYLHSESYKNDYQKVLDFTKLERADFLEAIAQKFNVSVSDVEAAEDDALHFISQADIRGYITKYGLEDYCIERFFLNLVSLNPDMGYIFGTEWLLQKIDNKDVERVIEVAKLVEIEQLEQEIDEDEVRETFDEADTDGYRDDVVNAAKALAIAFGKRLSDVLDELEEPRSGCLFTYGGNDYYIGTEDNITDEAMEYLTQDPFIWKECVANDGTQLGLEDWAKEVIDLDGFDSILNGYDGTCKEYEIDGETIYVVPREISASQLN